MLMTCSKIALIAVGVVLAVIVIIFFVANYLVSFALDSKSFFGIADEEISEEQQARWTRITESAKKVSIQSKDNITLNALLISHDGANGRQGGAHKYVIFVHGYNSVAASMDYIVAHYIAREWNVLFIEQRAHGESSARYIGMGHFEKDDLKRWISFIENIDSEAKILLHGISMGAATVMLAAGEGLSPSVLAIIEDCGYSTLTEEFTAQLKQMFSMPYFPLIPVASVVCKIRAGYFFSDVDCVKAVARSKTPILFIHGEDDAFVPFFMLDALYEAAACEKERLVVPSARHAEAGVVNPGLYWSAVDAFTQRHFGAL